MIGPSFDAEPKVVIVHDFLCERGGAERVALDLLETFPGATLYTALFRPDRTYPGFADHDVRSLLPGNDSQNDHRRLLPIAVAAFARLVVDADVLICSSSGISHHARVRDGKKIIYCHTPARWLHRPSAYFKGFGSTRRLVGSGFSRVVRPIDKRRMLEADHVIVNARVIANEVRKVFGIETEILHPVSSLVVTGAEEAVDIAPGFYFTPSRLLGYKRVDLINKAAALLPEERFVVMGGGPFADVLRASAPDNVTYLGIRSDSELRWLYRNARSVILTCAEDFGLVPGEAAAFGTASVVPDARGFRDEDGGHENTITYRFGDVEDLVGALRDIPLDGAGIDPSFDIERLQKHFRERFLALVTGSS